MLEIGQSDVLQLPAIAEINKGSSRCSPLFLTTRDRVHDVVNGKFGVAQISNQLTRSPEIVQPESGTNVTLEGNKTYLTPDAELTKARKKPLRPESRPENILYSVSADYRIYFWNDPHRELSAGVTDTSYATYETTPPARIGRIDPLRPDMSLASC